MKIQNLAGGGGRLEAVDCLRGIAIVTVLLSHILLICYHRPELPWNGMFRSFKVEISYLCFLPISCGVVGVAIFFVVSGFCIHSSYQSVKSWKAFYNRRFFRIYPLYFVVLIAASFWCLSFPSPYQFLTHLFLVHNYSPATFFAINGPFWSLAIEVQLYLIYPILLFLVQRFGWKKTMILVAGLETTIRETPRLMEILGQGNPSGNWIWLLQVSPFGFWCSWSLGAYVADGYLNGKKMPLEKAPLGFWLVLAVGSYFFYPLQNCMFLLISIVTAIILTHLLKGTISFQSAPVSFKKWLSISGEWSYSLYLIHYPLLLYLCFSFTALVVWPMGLDFYDQLLCPPNINHYNLLKVAIGLLTLPVIYGISAACYRFVEKPGIALGKKLFTKQTPTVYQHHIPDSP